MRDALSKVPTVKLLRLVAVWSSCSHIVNKTSSYSTFAKGKEDGIKVLYKDETIWATQKAMVTLFDVGVPAISKHLKNIFESGELQKEMVVSKMEITTTKHGAIEGKTQTSQVEFYNLDAIIPWGIASIPFAPRNSANGVLTSCVSLPSVGML